MSVRLIRPVFFLIFSVSEPEAQRGDRPPPLQRRRLPPAHSRLRPPAAASRRTRPMRLVCPGPTTVPAACISAAHSSIHTADEAIDASRRCLRRVFSRTRCLTSATRLAVSYIPLEPPLRICLKLQLKNPFTYIGTKNRKNSHPKRKIFQKNLRAAKKQLSESEYSVISSAISGKRTIFPPPPAAPAGRRRCTAPRRRRR